MIHFLLLIMAQYLFLLLVHLIPQQVLDIPTGYTQYSGARNDTLAINWGSLFGLPSGVVVDNYEVYIENRSTDTFVHWHVKDIPNSVTSLYKSTIAYWSNYCY